MDDRRPTFPLHQPDEPIGSDAAAQAPQTVQRQSSPVVYYGTDHQVGGGFRIALQIMGLGADHSTVGIALTINTPNTEDS